MAKKDKAEKAAKDTGKKGGKIVTIADLAEKHGVEGRKIRMIARAIGLNAPATDQKEGEFGPRAKYEWKEGDAELKKLEEAIKNPPKKEEGDGKKKSKKDEKKAKDTKGGKKKGKKDEDEEEEDEEEEEDTSDDDSDDEDEDEDDDE